MRTKAKRLDGDFYYVSLHEIAEELNLNTYYSSKVRKAILYVGEHKITVTAFNPFVLLGGKVIQMPLATRYERGDIHVPLKFFTPILRPLLEGATDAPPDLEPAGPGPNLLGVQVDEKTNGTLIRVLTAGKFDRKNLSIRYSRRWLYLDVLNGRLDEKTFAREVARGLVKKIVPVIMDEMVQVSFQLKTDISLDDIRLSQQNNEIFISIPSRDSPTLGIRKKIEDNQKKWRFDKIILDPGHGGKDPGTIGRSGTYEKDVVLAIAKRLEKLLKRGLDIDVLMTRTKDEYISLKERTRFANANGGKLFISIHANSNRNSRVAGATTYFLGLAKSDEALEISRRENSAIKYEEDSADQLTDEQMILAVMAQNSFNKQSQDFAALVQKEMHQQTALRDRGVKQAGFYVMVGASMPNVLVETAFMSNKKEEKLLKSKAFQDRVARALFNSIKGFKERYEWASAK